MSEKDQPSTIVQAGGRVADNIVTGLSGTPALLLIVILNIAMILAAAYYLSKQEEYRAATISQVTRLLTICFGQLPEPNHRPEGP